MLVSRFQKLCAVGLPFHGRQEYMIPFDLENICLPQHLTDYTQLVTDLCKAAGAKIGQAFLTVDEKVVEKGCTQRRPHPHVDGCFMPEMGRWGHGGGGWNHGCNAVPIPRMPVIVASSVSACKAWEGDFDAEPINNGDLSHIKDQLNEGELLPANVGYLLSPDCVHESLPMKETVERTFIRIALPVGTAS
jgi:hypothetical protein